MVGLVLLLVAGCGTGGPNSNETAVEPSPSESPSRSVGSGSADPNALGIDNVHWPRRSEEVGPLLRKLPKKVAGLSRHRPGMYGRYELVIYAMAPTSEVPDPTSMLSAMFGLGMVCKPSTYTGTATPGWKHAVPGVGPGRDGELWWFACEAGESRAAAQLRDSRSGGSAESSLG